MTDAERQWFQRRILGIRLRIWAIAGVLLLIGLAATAVLWAIVWGRDVVAIVGDVLTFLTLVAAIVALRYAAQSAQAGRDTVKPLKDMAADLATTAETMKANLELAERVNEQRDYEVMPRLRVRWLGPAGVHTGLSFYNVGGPAPKVVWVGTYDGNLRAAYASLPGAHTEYIEFGTDDLGPIPDGREVKNRWVDTLTLIAQDIYGRWWNCLLDQRVSDEPKAYLLEQLQHLGLQDFAGRVYQVGRLDRDRPDA